MDAYWVEIPRDVVRLTGPDAASYLQSQVSQDLRAMRVGESAWTFLLQPTGKVDVLARVLRSGDETFVLDTDAGYGETLLARLQRFKIRVKAELEAVEGWRCISVRGADASAAVPASDGTSVVVGWGGGADLLGPAVAAPEGIEPATLDRWHADRIEAAWPAMGSEIVPGETIPAETGVTAVAVSFTKGCYPGQELVERMDSRGAGAPRVLQVVDVPAGSRAGDDLVRDGEVIGTVTSVVGTRALASVKRSAVQSSAS
jgi:folate-binding protein YgfZ